MGWDIKKGNFLKYVSPILPEMPLVNMVPYYKSKNLCIHVVPRKDFFSEKHVEPRERRKSRLRNSHYL